MPLTLPASTTTTAAAATTLRLDVVPSVCVLSTAVSAYVRFGLFLAQMVSPHPLDPLGAGSSNHHHHHHHHHQQHEQQQSVNTGSSTADTATDTTTAAAAAAAAAAADGERLVCDAARVVTRNAFGIVRDFALALLLRDLRCVPSSAQLQLDDEFSSSYNALPDAPPGAVPGAVVDGVSGTGEAADGIGEGGRRRRRRGVRGRHSSRGDDAAHADADAGAEQRGNGDATASPSSTNPHRSSESAATTTTAAAGAGRKEETKASGAKRSTASTNNNSSSSSSKQSKTLLIWDTLDAPIAPEILPAPSNVLVEGVATTHGIAARRKQEEENARQAAEMAALSASRQQQQRSRSETFSSSSSATETSWGGSSSAQHSEVSALRSSPLRKNTAATDATASSSDALDTRSSASMHDLDLSASFNDSVFTAARSTNSVSSNSDVFVARAAAAAVPVSHVSSVSQRPQLSQSASNLVVAGRGHGLAATTDGDGADGGGDEGGGDEGDMQSTSLRRPSSQQQQQQQQQKSTLSVAADGRMVFPLRHRLSLSVDPSRRTALRTADSSSESATALALHNAPPPPTTTATTTTTAAAAAAAGTQGVHAARHRRARTQNPSPVRFETSVACHALPFPAAAQQQADSAMASTGDGSAGAQWNGTTAARAATAPASHVGSAHGAVIAHHHNHDHSHDHSHDHDGSSGDVGLLSDGHTLSQADAAAASKTGDARADGGDSAREAVHDKQAASGAAGTGERRRRRRNFGPLSQQLVSSRSPLIQFQYEAACPPLQAQGGVTAAPNRTAEAGPSAVSASSASSLTPSAAVSAAAAAAAHHSGTAAAAAAAGGGIGASELNRSGRGGVTTPARGSINISSSSSSRQSGAYQQQQQQQQQGQGRVGREVEGGQEPTVLTVARSVGDAATDGGYATHSTSAHTRSTGPEVLLQGSAISSSGIVDPVFSQREGLWQCSNSDDDDGGFVCVCVCSRVSWLLSCFHW